MLKKILVCTLCLILSTSIYSQEEEKSNFKKRILFILDGSGSMNEKWLGETKWEMAINTLSGLIDSFEKVNQDFEIGVRVLGHQYPRREMRCDDTKLEIDFSKDLSFESVYGHLVDIKPQGYTPLAYTISESEKDFKGDFRTQNIIILITDGLENCDGNPCEVANRLKAKNIFINPYIIGLGIDSLLSKDLECIGQYIDAKDKKVFKQVIKTILKEVSTRTTLTVSFVKSDSSEYLEYVPFSLVDRRTGIDINNFVYSSDTKKYKDTINVNPQYQYHLLVHTNPPFFFPNFKIERGIHQHYTVPIESGIIGYDNPYLNRKNQFFLRNKNMRDYQWHTGLIPLVRLEDSCMKLDYNMLPIQTYQNIEVREGSKYDIKAIPRGSLVIKKDPKILATLFTKNWEKVITLNQDLFTNLDISTGEYYLLYNSRYEESERTKYKPIQIIENQTTKLLLE